MSDLSSLMQVAPYAGGYMAGQQNTADLAQKDAETQRLQGLIQQLSIANQQSQNMNPLLVQHQDLQNQGLQAGLPGITADSNLKTTNATKAAGTLSTDIAAGNATNQGKIMADNGQLLKNAGLFIKSNPGVPPGIAMTKFAQDNGIPQDHPVFQTLVQGASNPDKMIQYGDDLVKHSAAYMQANDAETQRAQAQRDVASIHAKNALDVEQKKIDAGKYDKAGTAVTVENMLLKSRNAAQSAEILSQAANVAQTAGDAESAAKYSARAVEARQRAAEDANNRAMGQPGINVPGVANLPSKDRATASAPVGDTGAAAPPVLNQAGQAQVAPQGAIQMLKQNPALRAAFDAKYGQGASAKYLGQ